MEKPATITLFCERCMGMFSFIAGFKEIPQLCPECADDPKFWGTPRFWWQQKMPVAA